jgi:hypothetical protein
MPPCARLEVPAEANDHFGGLPKFRLEPPNDRFAPIKAVQTSGTVSPEQSLMAAAANGWDGW